MSKATTTTTDTGTDADVKIRKKTFEKTKRPSLYVVVLHNDPFTPRTFVVSVLQQFFSKSIAQATSIMLLAHNYGVGVVATYTHEIAEAKADQVNRYALEQGYPLQFSVQPE
jgi:ATP-dependent Clp protease adaptor protein ClpS